jgi:hypothetical protein
LTINHKSPSDTTRLTLYVRSDFIKRLAALAPHGLSRLVNAALEVAMRHPDEVRKVAIRGRELRD